MTRLLYAISRDHAHRHDDLKQAFGDSEHVAPIVDRRCGERGRRAVEGRRGERGPSSARSDVGGRGWGVVRPSGPEEDVGAQRRQPVGVGPGAEALGARSASGAAARLRVELGGSDGPADRVAARASAVGRV